MPVRPSSRLLALALVAALLAAAGALAGDARGRAGEAPRNNGQPTITGSAVEGQTITGHNGSWFCNPGPCTYEFQWQRCSAGGTSCADIAGAANQTYTVAAEDRGSTLRVAVTGTNYDCDALNQNCHYSSATAYSQPTAVVPGGAPSPPDEELAPTSNAPPAVAGVPEVGQTLTASPGDWSGSKPITYAYRWNRCHGVCAPVAGATGTAYAVSAADVGAAITVTVTATNEHGSAAATSLATSAVSAPAEVAPLSMSPPMVFGTAKEGETLTAAAGSWSGAPAPTFAFSWQRCDRQGGGCRPIPGASAGTYVATAHDGGRRLRVAVVATNAGGTATAVSGPTAVVAPKGLVRLGGDVESVPAAGVLYPDRLRIGSLRFTRRGPSAWIRAGLRVSDTRGYVVRGALVTVRGRHAGEVTAAARGVTALDGRVTVAFRVSAAKLRRGGTLVLVLRATKQGDLAAESVARSISVALKLPKRS
jgi:hypothetical protein